MEGARFVPELVDLAAATVEATGAARGTVGGVRFLAVPPEGLRTASVRLPTDVGDSFAIPSRLGGGFAFVRGDMIYRTDEWLGELTPIFHITPTSVVIMGLDRAYVRMATGAHLAFDPRSGQPLDLGPWPQDPFVGSYVALDAWRAFAMTDVQGVVATGDAGRSWVPVELAMPVSHLTPVRRDTAHGQWVIVAPNGPADAVILSDVVLGSAGATPHCFLGSSTQDVSPLLDCEDVRAIGAPEAGTERRFETKALRAAVMDGWPLTDRTALVAASGELVRVALDDGSVVSHTPDSLGRSLSRCHAVSLAHEGSPGAFGFVCSEAPAGTVLLRYDEPRARLVVERAFDTPRQVQTSGGAWLVQGSCGADARPELYCLGVRGERQDFRRTELVWREERARPTTGVVGVTTDGHFAELSSPSQLDTARLFVEGDPNGTLGVPISFPEAPPGIRYYVQRGVWVGGLRAEDDGTLGGWIAADGTIFGVRMARDGSVRVGAFVRDLGSPFVSGRFGFGWTKLRAGFETTDGGLSWTRVGAPLPLGPSRIRSCGPIGCVGDGWLRVGWGDRPPQPTALPSAPPVARTLPALLRLDCEPVDSISADGVHALLRGAPSAFASTDTAIHVHVARGLDGDAPVQPLAEVVAWGPASGEWTGRGRWVARWRSPFASRSSMSASAVTPAPFADSARAHAELEGRGTFVWWNAAVSDDGSHAILAERQAQRSQLLTLSEGAKLSALTREDGEPWPVVDSALRVGGDWYLVATDPRKTTVDLFQARGGGAHLFARVVRHVSSVGGPAALLARATDGTALGLVLPGEPTAPRRGASRWVVPIELGSGKVDTPELLGAADLSDRPVTLCGQSGAGGWVVDSPWPNARVSVGIGETATPLRRVFSRMRLSSDRACLERIAGEAGVGELQRPSSRPKRAPSAEGSAIPVVVVTDGPIELRCEAVAGQGP
jgi:hypothetical protein